MLDILIFQINIQKEYQRMTKKIAEEFNYDGIELQEKYFYQNLNKK